MKKFLVGMVSVITLAVGGLVPHTSAQEAEANYEFDMESIVVGTTGSYPPFFFDEDGETVGYSMDVWKEFEERTGVTVEFEITDFSGLLGLLESGRADLIDAQLSETPERLEKFDFTEPLTYYGAVIVVAEDNEDIQGVDDLAGKTIGVGSGNNMQVVVDEMYPDGDITWEVYTTATLDNMMRDVEMGRLDGMLSQNIQAQVAINESGAALKLTEPFDMQTGAWVINQDQEDLLNALNAFIQEIKGDGTLAEISNKWIGIDISQPSEETEAEETEAEETEAEETEEE